MSDIVQELLSRVGGLSHALDNTLRMLAIIDPENARRNIESLRDLSINDVRNSDIPADREMDHAQIARPAIEVIEIVFNQVLGSISNENPNGHLKN